ncbi:MAG: hypothetical protein J5615_01640 [Fibrobacter sp.]|nr:hypothetical protein [Fibrobacter sp.]
MCEYCEGAKPIIGDEQDGACIEQGNVLHSYGECTEFAEGKINFCPMCGRKLTNQQQPSRAKENNNG